MSSLYFSGGFHSCVGDIFLHAEYHQSSILHRAFTIRGAATKLYRNQRPKLQMFCALPGSGMALPQNEALRKFRNAHGHDLTTFLPTVEEVRCNSASSR